MIDVYSTKMVFLKKKKHQSFS